MSGSRSLLPREHGAYAELAFPLATGLALSPPTLSALGLALGTIAFFLAHEPLAILLGARGPRLQAQETGRARGRVAFLLGAGVLFGGLGVAGAGPLLWPSLLYPAGALLLLLPLVFLGHQKTMVGEILVLTVFATLVFPLGAASGAEFGRMTSAVVVWWGSFFLGTLEVHAIKARHKTNRRSQWTRWGSPTASTATVLLCSGLAFFGGGSYRWPASALLLPALEILVLSILRVHPKHLKRVGWTLVGTNIVVLIILLVSG